MLLGMNAILSSFGLLEAGLLELQKLTICLGLQRARSTTQSVHGEESWYLRRNRPHGTFDARWTYAAFHGIGLGICLGITSDFPGESMQLVYIRRTPD